MVPAPPIVPIVERAKKWVARKVFLLGMITTLNMPGWEPEERICLGNFLFHPYHNIIIMTIIITLEPLIKDPLRKGYCMLNLSTRDTVWSPKNYHFLLFLFIENLRKEDNLPIRDKTAEFIVLFPKCPLFGGSTVHVYDIMLFG